jgi:hypothetical protein
MRTRVVAVLALGSIALAMGCGRGASEGSADKRQVERMVTAWLSALVAHDNPRACSYLAPALQKSIDEQLRLRGEHGNCRTWAARWTGGSTPPGHRSARVTAVRITGREATVTLHAASGLDSVVRVRKLGGNWRIENY